LPPFAWSWPPSSSARVSHGPRHNLVRHAVNVGVDKMVAEVVDNQVGAKRAFAKLGFHEEAVLKGQVKDRHGVRRDLVIMANDVSYLWEAMEALVADYSRRSRIGRAASPRFPTTPGCVGASRRARRQPSFSAASSSSWMRWRTIISPCRG